MRFKKVLGILRTKIRLLLMIGVLLAAAAGCQFAGEYLHSHYIREEASETSGNISEKKTVVIDSGHGGKDPGKVGINGAQEKEEEKEEELEAILFSRSAVTNSFFNKLIPGKPEKKVNISELEKRLSLLKP